MLKKGGKSFSVSIKTHLRKIGQYIGFPLKTFKNLIGNLPTQRERETKVKNTFVSRSKHV
ncbi:hypothetical protein DY87_0105860 [Enterococcus faecium UC7256]|nr:hypothetical protein DY87_0105860 [Enterococcus faecium UC7256]